MPRGRPKKINNLETDEQVEVEVKPAGGFKKSVTHIERYTEPVEPEQLELVAESRESHVDLPKDPFDVVLGDFGASNGAEYIKVYKLPEYAKTGVKTNRHIVRDFCANIPVTPDYENVIKEQWGAGHYQLDLRHSDGSFAAGKYISIAAPVFSGPGPARNGQNAATVNSAPGNGISYEIPDPMAQMNATLDLIAKMRRSFGGEVNLQPPPQQPATPPLTTESALLHLVSQDGEVIDQFTHKLKSVLRRNDNGSHELTVLDLVDTALKMELLPKMLDKAKQLILEIKGGLNGTQTVAAEAVAPGGQVQNPQDGRNQTGDGVRHHVQTSQIQTAQTVSPEPGDSLSMEQQVIGRTLQTLLTACSEHPLHLAGCEFEECKAGNHMMPTCNWVLNQEVAHPFLSDLINLFINSSSDQITAWINSQSGGPAYTSLPHWAEWVANLQKALKESTEEEPEGGES
jgi:hypothetical protein